MNASMNLDSGVADDISAEEKDTGPFRQDSNITDTGLISEVLIPREEYVGAAPKMQMRLFTKADKDRIFVHALQPKFNLGWNNKSVSPADAHIDAAAMTDVGPAVSMRQTQAQQLLASPTNAPAALPLSPNSNNNNNHSFSFFGPSVLPKITQALDNNNTSPATAKTQAYENNNNNMLQSELMDAKKKLLEAQKKQV